MPAIVSAGTAMLPAASVTAVVDVSSAIRHPFGGDARSKLEGDKGVEHWSGTVS